SLEICGLSSTIRMTVGFMKLINNNFNESGERTRGKLYGVVHKNKQILAPCTLAFQTKYSHFSCKTLPGSEYAAY
ncbi:MAG TPA: hypothetical protein PLA15_07680, partial [bacterium]|nr:hypothetical protein [bacterium]